MECSTPSTALPSSRLRTPFSPLSPPSLRTPRSSLGQSAVSAAVDPQDPLPSLPQSMCVTSDVLLIFGLFSWQSSGFYFSLTYLHSSFEYDGTSNRWKNVRPPVTGSTVTATGTFQDISDGGHGEPILSLLDISYGATETVGVTSPTCTIGHRRTGVR